MFYFLKFYAKIQVIYSKLYYLSFHLNYLKMISKTQALRQQNELLKKKIQEFESQRLSVENIDHEIKKFISQSEKNVNSMTEKMNQENAAMSKQLHELTAEY